MIAINDGLETLQEPNGTVPETRMKSAVEAQGIFQSLWLADQQYRSPKRARVKGLVDGNPPYRQGDLRNAGRSNDCNVNWRIAEAYLNSALGAFYDIFSEAPTYTTIKLDVNDKSDAEEKSRIVTEEFDRLQRREAGFDYNMQISQYEMVLYGFGPFFFEDKLDWRASAGRCGDFFVPNEARSTTSKWELCMMRVEYLPHQLYEFIRDEKAAKEMGWDVELCKKAIMDAHPRTENNVMSWEWYQQLLKDGSFWFSYQAGSKKIFTVHMWCKEFPKEGEVEGRISHKIFMENYNLTTVDGKQQEGFLFEAIGRYANWDECVHPMYYDRGGGGDHHSVTGMGVKMYSAIEYQNRLLCRMADDAFSPKKIFKPTGAGQTQKMQLAVLGDYAIMPNGFDLVQTPIAPMMQDAMVFNREVSQVVSANLSQYRQNIQKEDGNPITATETQWRASEQSRLGKTQLNRYYEQLDGIYAEKFRRACNPNLSDKSPGGKEALEFQERCFKRGLTKSDLQRIDSVQATRIIGQGSAFMRQQMLESMLGIISMLPEAGRQRVIQDLIAAKAGQAFVSRYLPEQSMDVKTQEQRSQAQDKVVGIKVGIPPLVTDTQNPVIYAETYLAAASQAVGSLEQGGNPMEVFSFLEVAGPAIAAQLARIAPDPTRKQVYELLNEQFVKLGKIHDQLQKQIQQSVQQQQQMAAQGQQATSEIQIKAAKTAAGIQQSKTKNDAHLAMQLQAHTQEMALKDAETAAAITRQSRNGGG